MRQGSHDHLTLPSSEPGALPIRDQSVQGLPEPHRAVNDENIEAWHEVLPAGQPRHRTIPLTRWRIQHDDEGANGGPKRSPIPNICLTQGGGQLWPLSIRPQARCVAAVGGPQCRHARLCLAETGHQDGPRMNKTTTFLLEEPPRETRHVHVQALHLENVFRNFRSNVLVNWCAHATHKHKPLVHAGACASLLWVTPSVLLHTLPAIWCIR
mmetsp:Transcript_76961/g.194385  ORF Transcript_76961/g.194385 Transcript_76961/m.194385 type:complete len:211 (+) Transcript_76961:2-634(+)